MSNKKDDREYDSDTAYFHTNKRKIMSDLK